MEIIKNSQNELTILGNIKTIDDYQAIRTATMALVNGGSTQIVYVMQDSLAMTSSVIGFLVKLVRHDKIQVSIQVHDIRLLELLEELALTELFRARFVGIRR